jgi:hypothetical protein
MFFAVENTTRKEPWQQLKKKHAAKVKIPHLYLFILSMIV